ncbi:MAG: hypothetical protein K8F91_18460 [Candidatus Obscuribacterales bacterium]|nr:hypothetical protein [Candidatus Obscuribacterales bacterium]
MIQLKESLILKSDPRVKKVGAGVLSVALAIGWVFTVLWLVVATFTLPYNIYWAFVLACTALAFGFLLTFMSYTNFRDGRRSYMLELTGQEAVLTVVDRLEKKRSTQMVLLDDIVYAEYYPYQDSKSIIFHTPYARMEVPLWPLPNRGQDVVDFIIGRGVKVVDVQGDDPIAETA